METIRNFSFYYVEFMLNGIREVMKFRTASQYQNFTAFMEERYHDSFSVIAIHNFEI